VVVDRAQQMPALVRKALMGGNSKPTSRLELQPQRIRRAAVEAPAYRQILRNASVVLWRSHENATPKGERSRDQEMQLAVPAGATFSAGKLGEPSHFFPVAPAI
jgi:hypothetical protein